MIFPRQNVFFLLAFLSLFIVKGLFFASIFPVFQGPDEQIHYGTVQYHAEPKEKTWPISPSLRPQVLEDIHTYNLSQETVEAASVLQLDEIRWQKENTQTFSGSATGINEALIAENDWKRYIDTTPKNASGTKSFYYTVGAWIESALSYTSFFTRFFAVRAWSVLLGALVVFLGYLTARKLGFSFLESVLVSVLVAFQPMFSFLSSIVNIDVALILSFSLFAYAATWILKDGFHKEAVFLLLFSSLLGLFSKGPGVVLVITSVLFLFFFLFLHFRKKGGSVFWKIFLGSLFLIVLALFLVPKSYLFSITNLEASSKFSSPLTSLSEYAEKALDRDAFMRTHDSYWGYFGWLDTKISESVLHFVWSIEALAWGGLLMFLLSKNPPAYLPQKKFILFFILLLFLLQLAIRFFDWRVFDTTGKIVIGTPGRYFLPTFIPHFFLIITGLGFFTNSKKQFGILLKLLALGMILLSLYSVINVILPRYYL